MKHNDILGQLDPLRKVALVASGLGDEGLVQAGIPAVGRVYLDDLANEKGVSYASAARSFDPALIGRMTRELASEAAKAGKKLFVTPDLKAATNPYATGLSEDAGLNGLIGASIASAVHATGMAVGLSALSMDEGDIAYLDRREDAGAVRDLVERPFLTAARARCEAVFLAPNRLSNGYPDTNRALFNDVQNGYFGDTFAVGDGVAANSSALTLLRGKVSLGGAAIPLERASRRYEQLKQYRAEGSISERDLLDAVRDGTALDERKLDEAAGEVIDFAMKVAKRMPANIPDSDVARKVMAVASIVLLKNQRILPLAKGTRVAVVGEAYADLSAFASRFTLRGRARGYERQTARSDALIPEAVRAAGGADVVLAFLYPDETGRSLTMPANRIALLQAIKKTGKRIVGIVCGDMPADLSFDSVLDALLIAPADGRYAAEALARVLTGEAAPGGRLTRTAYDNGDAYFKKLCEERDAGRLRVGGFVGYLRYDTARERVRYPFGFGLSYTKFAYSGLSVNGDKISFTVRNTGSRFGYEVAQIYIGAPTDTTFQPRKRLKAVCKFALKPGESKKATVTLTPADYATYDPVTLTDNVEAGTYTIYVCANAQEVRLQGKRSLPGVKRKPATEIHPADYFPDGPFVRDESPASHSRVGLHPEEGVPKPLHHLRRAALWVFPISAVLFFMLFTVYICAYLLDYALVASLDIEAVKWGVYGLAVLMLAIVPLLGSFNRRRLSHVRTGALIVCLPMLLACLVLGIMMIRGSVKGDTETLVMTVLSCIALGTPLMAIVAAITEHVLVKSKSGANSWQKYYFTQAKPETKLPDAAFEEAFRAADEARAEAEEVAPEDPIQYFDKELTFAEMLRDGTLYVKERGFDPEENTMRGVFAAVAAAQLIIVPYGMGAALMGAVAEYFGKKPYIDNAEQYTQSSDLFTQWKTNERTYHETALTQALEACAREPAFLHIAVLRHAEASRLGKVFETVADCIARRRASLPLPDGTDCVLPQNLRIVAEVEEKDLGAIPASISEVAAILLPRCSECAVLERKSVVQSVGFDRFTAMRHNVRDEYPLGEMAWKNVDGLTERCRSAHVGNILWVKTEIHAAVLSACGAEDDDAIDGALAAEALPWLFEVWDTDLCDGTLTDALVEIFGKNTKLCNEFLDARGDGKIKR